MRKLLLHWFALFLAVSAAPAAAWADSLDSGTWDSPYGRVKFERDGARLVARLSESGKVCGFAKGEEVLRGQVEDELFTGEARLCYPAGCASDEWALTLALATKSPARWLGGVVEPERGCPPTPKGASFKLERPKAPSVAALPTTQVGKFRSKEAEDLFAEARAARGSFDLRTALKALKIADAKEPDHPDILLEMADVYRQLKEPEKARDVLAKVAKKDKKFGNYNLACLEAQVGNRQQALSYLEKAVQAGWAYYDETLADRDLEPLHGMAEFELLLAKVQKNAERRGPRK